MVLNSVVACVHIDVRSLCAMWSDGVNFRLKSEKKHCEAKECIGYSENCCSCTSGGLIEKDGKFCIFISALDLVVGFLMSNGHFGPFAELFVVAEAKRMIK